MTDVLPFHALSPSTFLQRHAKILTHSFSAIYKITPSSITVTGDRAENGRPKSLERLFDGFKSYLPKDFGTTVVVSDHDLGSQVLGEDQRRRALELVKEGECEW